MHNRHLINLHNGRRKRALVFVTVLALIADILFPAFAISLGSAETVLICTPEGYKNVRIDQDGEPLPMDQSQAGHDCTVCHVCELVSAPVSAANAVWSPNTAPSQAFHGEVLFTAAEASFGKPRAPPCYL
jgi:hypothetical protein